MFTKLESDITFSDIKAFCDEYREGVRVEYKQKIRHIPKIVSSFANMQGGIFIIGVETDNETNRVVAIDGISNPGGLEEQIIQSALTGIYPAVQPEVIIREVPDTDNVVVIIRVAESPQAPHAIQNSTRVYIRTGSITQPYELAEIDRIEYLLKRREKPQITTQQIIDRTEERVERLFCPDMPDITVIARPVFSHRPIISTRDIFEFAREADLSWLYSSRVMGGWVASTQRDSEFYAYWELNEYGIVYHRQHLDKIDRYSNSHEAKYLNFRRFVWEIGRTIEKATSLYKKCGYLGDVDITVQLRRVFDETLLFYKFYSGILRGHIKPDDIEKQQCLDSQVLVSLQCLPQDFIDRNKFIDTVDELTNPLLWAFNITVNDAGRKELVEQLLLGERIL